MLFADAALARRLEAAETAVARECSGRGAVTLEAAGGVAVFAGVDSPLTQATGIGMNGRVSEQDLARLEDFFRSRGARPKIEISPLADPELIRMLGERGYRISDFLNVLVRRLESSQWPETPRVHAADGNMGEQWCLTVGRGFFEKAEISEDEMEVGRAIAGMANVRCYLGWNGEDAAAGGALSICDRMACLFADSTVKEFRGRGLHRELIAARLRDACAQGCDAATASTVPGSGSQRNYERSGFQVAYTRVTLTA